ncbi:MAG: glycosyltransferase family 2 protein [Acidobacteria bacterium]|nr:glycosyltransferase family 2 protein [Acidobacteriota bacterium]
MTPTADVLIVSYNTREDLGRCLASLHEHPPRHLARTIVIDNASTDGSVEDVGQRWPDVEIIALERNAGFAAANNAGIRRATAPLVLLLNSDTVVAAGAIDRLVERLEATRAVAAGPRLIDGRGRPEVSFGPMLSPWGEALQMLRVRLARAGSPAAQRYIDRLVARERVVDWVSGACLLVRRAAAIDAGLLDERYFMYEEDVDFCAALRARGGSVLFTPASEIVHLRGRSAARAGAAMRRVYDRSHLAFYEKHLPAWAPILRLWLRIKG